MNHIGENEPKRLGIETLVGVLMNINGDVIDEYDEIVLVLDGGIFLALWTKKAGSGLNE